MKMVANCIQYVRGQQTNINFTMLMTEHATNYTNVQRMNVKRLSVTLSVSNTH